MKKNIFSLMLCAFLPTICWVRAMDTPSEPSSKAPPKTLPTTMTKYGLHQPSGGQLSLLETLVGHIRQAFNYAVDRSNPEQLTQNFFKRFGELRTVGRQASAVFKAPGSFQFRAVVLGGPLTQLWNYDLNKDSDKDGLLYCFKILTETGKNRDYLLSGNKQLTKFSPDRHKVMGDPDKDRNVYNIYYEEESENASSAIVLLKDFYLVEGRGGPISDLLKELNAQQ